MITRYDLDERVRAWNLQDSIVEKDYVLGWMLWGIGNNPHLRGNWVFKGGTCLKKCYIEKYRFSEDLDFTVFPNGPIVRKDLAPILKKLLQQVNEATGMDFSEREPLFKEHDSGLYSEVRIYFHGPRNASKLASIKLDLSAYEKMVCAPVYRPIFHDYPDALPEPATVAYYDLAEIFAEKIRAMGERGRPRDLYDIINLFQQNKDTLEPWIIREILVKKCATKKIPIPTVNSLRSEANLLALESEWCNMLARQLPILPPLNNFWNELDNLFDWLNH